MKKNRFCILIALIGLLCMSVGNIQARVIYGPVTDPNFTYDDPSCTRVAVYGPTDPSLYGGSVTFESEDGETFSLYTNTTYFITWFFFIKKGTYKVTSISTNCNRIMCNGKEIKIGSVISFTNGGYLGFFRN